VLKGSGENQRKFMNTNPNKKSWIWQHINQKQSHMAKRHASQPVLLFVDNKIEKDSQPFILKM
jgi:hypothetical protein